mmetsp:Transcript_4053/g.16949  ORF Transcript_4053/g.16949 Transcript_4053/m.16949 type:complete len:405 (-) Transcript_4053:2625-3839(-)
MTSSDLAWASAPARCAAMSEAAADMRFCDESAAKSLSTRHWVVATATEDSRSVTLRTTSRMVALTAVMAALRRERMSTASWMPSPRGTDTSLERPGMTARRADLASSSAVSLWPPVRPGTDSGVAVSRKSGLPLTSGLRLKRRRSEDGKSVTAASKSLKSTSMAKSTMSLRKGTSEISRSRQKMARIHGLESVNTREFLLDLRSSTTNCTTDTRRPVSYASRMSDRRSSSRASRGRSMARVSWPRKVPRFLMRVRSLELVRGPGLAMAAHTCSTVTARTSSMTLAGLTMVSTVRIISACWGSLQARPFTCSASQARSAGPAAARSEMACTALWMLLLSKLLRAKLTLLVTLLAGCGSDGRDEAAAEAAAPSSPAAVLSSSAAAPAPEAADGPSSVSSMCSSMSG